MQQKKLVRKQKVYLDFRNSGGGGLMKFKDLLIRNWCAINNGSRLKRERKGKTKLPGKRHLWYKELGYQNYNSCVDNPQTPHLAPALSCPQTLGFNPFSCHLADK